MVCPSCGTLAEGPGMFCAKCGARLPEPETNAGSAGGFAAAPPPPPPPAWSQPQAAPPPPPPAWSQPQAAPPPPPAAFGAPGPYGAPGYATPVAAPMGRANPALFAGIIALIGGAAAIASAWLPWAATRSGDAIFLPSQMTKDMGDPANGIYLIAAGVVAAAAGLALLLGLAKSSGLRMALGAAAIVAGAVVLVVEFGAYGHVNDMINGRMGGQGFVQMGTALYAGAAAGVAAVVGGVLALVMRR